MPTFYAKSGSLHGKVTNKKHLEKVAELAEVYGREIGCPQESRLAGNLHDFGKNSPRFQGVLDGTFHCVDHALPGAALLYMALHLHGKSTDKCAKYAPLIESIQGHHDGLVGLPKLADILYTTYTDPDADCCPSSKVPSLRGAKEFQAAWQAFLADFPGWHMPALPTRDYCNMVEDMLDTRMLFSCLVDADYSVSAADNDPLYLQKASGSPLDADAASRALYEHCAALRARSTADPALNAIRNRVFEQCGTAGEAPCGLFTLTAPTGVGKTLAMLHFALRHCKTNGLRRIIIVLPFLTLAEQSEREYAKILPNILVDHSQKNLPDEAHELAARWDAPMILTTSVKFFESLFADKPTDCRKLHSVANSVVIFDEAQSLPADLALATVQAVNRLCQKYRCSMVFSTATQPDFHALPSAEWKPVEILPDGPPLYKQMRRVQVEWRLFVNDDRHQNPTFTEIAEEMSALPSVCAIVNLRRHARELFHSLQGLCENDGLFLLTTDLCPAHRLEVVDKIRARLKAGQPCRVVATQCIEAGVDLDFDVMYRALAPLEAIIQAAGRCNRNGRLPGGGRFIVFEPADTRYPGGSYERASNIVKDLWAENNALDINTPALIQAYYRLFFCNVHGRTALDTALRKKDYAAAAREYKLITQSGVQLIVPWSGKDELFTQIQAEVRVSGLTAAVLRQAAPITVSCFDRDWVEQHAEPLYFPARRGHLPIQTNTYILNAGQERFYDNLTGLTPDSTLPEDFMV